MTYWRITRHGSLTGAAALDDDRVHQLRADGWTVDPWWPS